MRLIDADELLKEFDPNGERLDPILVRSRIVQQPTAYDVEKVVAEIKERVPVYTGVACDIVKRGGVE